MTPLIALVGDSMRLHYQPHVIDALAGVAHVWGPEMNCESSRHLRANLDPWVLNRLDGATTVHVNAGAHDIRRTPETDWRVQVPVDEYRDNMIAIVDRLRAHDSIDQVIVATTTPVNEGRHQTARYSDRRNDDVAVYNSVVVDVATERRLVVSDLWSAVWNCPFDAISDDGVHLTNAGYSYLGHHVSQQLTGVVLSVRNE
jgi:isoamyl acetate esterase